MYVNKQIRAAAKGAHTASLDGNIILLEVSAQCLCDRSSNDGSGCDGQEQEDGGNAGERHLFRCDV